MQFLNRRGNPETKILNIFLLLFSSFVLHILCFVQKITVKRPSQGEICSFQNRSLWMTNPEIYAGFRYYRKVKKTRTEIRKILKS